MGAHLCSILLYIESCKHWLGREGQRNKMDMISLMAQRKNERILGTIPQTDKMDERRVGSQTDADNHDMRSKGNDRKHDEDDFEPKSIGDCDKKEDRRSRKHGDDGPRPREEKDQRGM